MIMKLEIYEPDKVGEVSVDPYEWSYSGRYASVTQLLDRHPNYQIGIAIDSTSETARGQREASNREYLEYLSRDLKSRGVWDTVIIE